MNIHQIVKLCKSHFIIGLLAFVAIANFSIAQQTKNLDVNAKSAVITNIIIVGNEKTKDHIILQEMKVKVGDTYNEERIKEDRNRIQNLQLFTRVEIYPTQSEEGLALVIWVSERWYIFPSPLLYINEHDWNKLSYGASLFHQNFRGRNETVYASFWLGYDPGAVLDYSNPWFGGERRLFTRISIEKGENRNHSLDFEPFHEKYADFSWAIGKRFGYYTFLSLDLGYRRLSVDLPNPTQVIISPNGTDELPNIGVSFRYDNRDLHEYPKNGIFVDLAALKTGFGSQIDYASYEADLRYYFPIWGNVSLGTRVEGFFHSGKVPVYSRVYLGYGERIRGHFADVREGDHRITANAELRFPILKIRYININSGPGQLRDYSNNLKFGISGGIFVDSGSVWYNRNDLQRDTFISGYGVGLHIHLPYVELLRIEYALDFHGDGEFIFDIGKSF